MNVPATMKCIVLSGPGGPEVLRIAERPVPRPGPGEVLIKVAAAGMNYSDTSKRSGRSPWEDRDLPYDSPERRKATLLPGQAEIMGMEVAGEVVAVGLDVSAPRIGDQVCALMQHGGYAQYAVAAAPLCLAREGRLISIATISGSKTQLDIPDVMGKHLTLSGSGLGNRTVEQKKVIADQLRERVWPLLGDGQPIWPRIHAAFPMKNVVEAHTIMDASAHTGKLVLTFGD